MNRVAKLCLVLVLSIFTLTGCSGISIDVNPDIRVEISVNKNQTVDIELDMFLDRVDFDIFNRTEAMLDDMVKTLRGEGFKADIVESGDRIGISASMRVDNRSGAHASGLNFKLDDFLEIRDYVVVSDYIVDERFNIRDMVLESGIVDNLALIETALEQSSIELVVRLPIRPAEHNGDRASESGREISWDIDPLEENHVQLRVTVPNVEKIGWFIGIVVILFIVLIFVIRKILISVKKKK